MPASLSAHSIRLLLIGSGNGEFRRAAEIAGQSGARVALVDTLNEAMETLRSTGADLVMVDVLLNVAELSARMKAEYFSVPILGCGVHAPADRAVAAIRGGALDYIPLPPDAAMIGAALQSVALTAGKLVGEDHDFVAARTYAEQVAPSALPMLISGPQGSGKQAMARHVHQVSGRNGPFVVQTLEAKSPELLSAELFGHDGSQGYRTGTIEQAKGGTLFIKHINLLPAQLQAHLLHLLTSAEDRSSVCNIIAACPAGRENEVTPGLVRALSGAIITLPSLKQRGNDVILLARYFAATAAKGLGMDAPGMTREAAETLLGYGWTGNCAELERVMSRAVALGNGDQIARSNLRRADGKPLDAVEPAGASREASDIDKFVGESMASVERALILSTLDKHGGNRTAASAVLGISVRTMRNKLKAYSDEGFEVPPAV